ncbi:MAG: proprotein convertase P-domain-containing protein [Planctomycetales bacterium]|nr:proprotein convertase P-domain-containing protein [Planctomycetales bacterium]
MNSALLLVGSTALLTCLPARHAAAQSGLRESLELLDRNQNGYIDPDEITSLSRPYLERIAEARHLSLERPNRVDKLQEAARVYYALKNGVAGERIQASPQPSVKGFGPNDDEPVVPEFGLAEVKYPYQQRDLDEADETLERYDRNRDGYMSRSEAARGRWTHRDPFLMDLNKDDQLSRLELAQRYARRRMVSDDAGELIQRSRRVGNGVRPAETETSDERRSRERSEWWRTGGDRYWLTAAVLGRFDANRNGRLEMDETVNLGIPTGAIDADQNGELSREELFAYFKELQDQTGDLVDGLPGWFYELDTNHDKQVDLTEFATELTDARVAEFVALDTNQDGLLAPGEVLASKSMMGGVFENREAEMLPPRKTIVSEIEVTENFLISDLNLRLTLTHTSVSGLDAYLTGPDGTRIELFTAVGGSDDHFERTLFDDQAGTSIVKGRAPFEGSFQPEGLIRREPGLSAFNGKSIEGVWQLTIRCSRSDRFGMLHSWSLIAPPDEESLLSRPELAASMASTLDAESPSTVNDESGFEPTETARIDFRRSDSLSRGLLSGGSLSGGSLSDVTLDRGATTDPTANYWTPERKAEFAAKIRKPSTEEWEKMSDDQKRETLALRAEALAEYKRALGKRGGEDRGEKVKSEFKMKDRENKSDRESKKDRRD